MSLLGVVAGKVLTLPAVLTLVCASVVHLSLRYWRILKHFDYMPGYRPFFPPLSLFGAIMPTCWWNLNTNWTWDLRKTAYFNMTHDIITIIPLIHGKPTYHIGSPEVANQLIGTENGLIKDEDNSVGVAYQAVLHETLSVYREMLEDDNRANKASFTINVKTITGKLGFLLIARCGFGLQVPWRFDASSMISEGEAEGQAIASALEKEFRLASIIARVVLPSWAYKLSPFNALVERDTLLRSFARKSIAERIREFEESRDADDADDLGALGERHDVFSKLIIANKGLDKQSLADDEVIGNIFFLMFAGNETTAMVLAETLTLLAIHQEEQETVYQELLSVLGEDDEPTLDQLDNLKHLYTCFLEGARLYPPGALLNRVLTEEAIVEVQHPTPARIVLPKGSKIAMDMVNMLRNPHTFHRPNDFVPSRWKTMSEYKLPVFGYGPRACIGRKFAQTEALTLLASLLRDWKLDVALENGETREQYATRVLESAAQDGLSFAVRGQMNLTFARRK